MRGRLRRRGRRAGLLHDLGHGELQLAQALVVAAETS